MHSLSVLMDFDLVAVSKTAAVVVVFVAFMVIVVRALGARPSAMRKGASMALDDLPPLDEAAAPEDESEPKPKS